MYKVQDKEKQLLQGVRVLFIEDDKQVLGVTTKLLRNRGAVVDPTENGLEGINKARITSFDVIVVDVDLPDMQLSFMELIGRLNVIQPQATIIVYTGYGGIIPPVNNLTPAVATDLLTAWIQKPDWKALVQSIIDSNKGTIRGDSSNRHMVPHEANNTHY